MKRIQSKLKPSRRNEAVAFPVGLSVVLFSFSLLVSVDAQAYYGATHRKFGATAPQVPKGNPIARSLRQADWNTEANIWEAWIGINESQDEANESDTFHGRGLYSLYGFDAWPEWDWIDSFWVGASYHWVTTECQGCNVNVSSNMAWPDFWSNTAPALRITKVAWVFSVDESVTSAEHYLKSNTAGLKIYAAWDWRYFKGINYKLDEYYSSIQ